LLHDFCGLDFIQVLVLDDVVKKFTTLAIPKISEQQSLLNDKEAHLVTLPNFKQLDDIRMIL
jgi:hypothetical protein